MDSGSRITLWPGLEHLGHLLEKDSEGGVLVSDQRECGGWVSPAAPFLLLTFTPEGLLRNLRYWEQYCKRQECSMIREEPRPGNGTRPDNTWPDISPYQALEISR